MALAIILGLLIIYRTFTCPIYEGKPLRFLVMNLYGTTNRQEINEAIGHLGTNAIPTLVRMIREQDNPAKRRLFEFLKERGWLARGIYDSWYVNCAATCALTSYLNSPTSVPYVVPTILAHRLGDPKADSETKIFIITALAAFNDDPNAKYGVPRLTELLRDTNYAVRSSASNALRRIDPEAALMAGIK